MANTRGASFPYIDLQQAIVQAKKLYAADSQHPMPRQIATEHLGYSVTGSIGKRSLGALLSFGLLDRVSGGDVRVTNAAARIILDENADEPSERLALIKDCALRPKLYSALWELYGNTLPSDANVRSKLILDLGLHKNAVSRFLKNYRATIAFAQLADSADTASPEAGAEDSQNQNGSSQIPIDEAEGKNYGSASEDVPSGEVPPPPQVPGTMGVASSVTPSSGVQVPASSTLRFPLPQGTVGEVSFSGPVTQNVVQKLIGFLELAKDSYPEQ